jgi:predicted Fe-S protein YdhL (DUF1289 family)
MNGVLVLFFKKSTSSTEPVFLKTAQSPFFLFFPWGGRGAGFAPRAGLGEGWRMSVTSPCIQECRLDPAGQACLGCLRTLAEIEMWPRMSQAARLGVMALLPQRRAALAAVALAGGARADPAQ